MRLWLLLFGCVFVFIQTLPGLAAVKTADPRLRYAVATIFFGDWSSSSDVNRNITLFNLRLAAKKMRGSNWSVIDTVLLTYQKTVTPDLTEWGQLHNVRIVGESNIPHFTRKNIKTNQPWEFCKGNMLKIFLWSLAEYGAILYLDMDHFLLEPFSPSAYAYLQRHGLVCWPSGHEPLNGGGFLLLPSPSAFRRLLSIVQHGFSTSRGWEHKGRPIQRAAFSEGLECPPKHKKMKTLKEVCARGVSSTWDFNGAGGDQGILYYAFGREVNCSRSLKPASRHFGGRDKPWNPIPRHVSAALRAQKFSRHSQRVEFLNKIIRENADVCQDDCALVHRGFKKA